MARFLKDEDYQTQIRTEILTILAGGLDDPKLLQAENAATKQMKNHLAGRADADLIFSQENADRDDFIIMTLIDLTLYHMYSGSAPRDIPDHRSTRYEDALKWMRSVATGKTISDLPPLEAYEGETRINSKTPEEHKW